MRFERRIPESMNELDSAIGEKMACLATVTCSKEAFETRPQGYIECRILGDCKDDMDKALDIMSRLGIDIMDWKLNDVDGMVMTTPDYLVDNLEWKESDGEMAFTVPGKEGHPAGQYAARHLPDWTEEQPSLLENAARNSESGAYFYTEARETSHRDGNELAMGSLMGDRREEFKVDIDDLIKNLRLNGVKMNVRDVNRKSNTATVGIKIDDLKKFEKPMRNSAAGHLGCVQLSFRIPAELFDYGMKADENAYGKLEAEQEAKKKTMISDAKEWMADYKARLEKENISDDERNIFTMAVRRCQGRLGRLKGFENEPPNFKNYEERSSWSGGWMDADKELMID